VGGRPIADNITYSFIERSFPHSFLKWGKIRLVAEDMVEKMTVRPRDSRRLIRYLSGGNQQKVVLGKLLAAESEIVILDEPTRGVDVGARNEIYQIVQQLLAAGKAIIMVSSDMTELLTQSDRILVMSAGKIVREIRGSEASEEMVLASALKED
jgi:ABC-type sugar transport system ATPase subunit